MIIYLFAVLEATFVHADQILTNPLASDGFGSQFRAIIYSVIYSEMTNKQFVYTPFVSMEHNYGYDVKFLEKKEELINFINNFEINKDMNATPLSQPELVYFFENHSNFVAESKSLKKIKAIFRENKNKLNLFNPKRFNVAIHLRRPNPHDNRIEGTDIPDDVYLKIIKFFRNAYAPEHPLFHIYSQGEVEIFQKIYQGDDIIFHIDESIENTFTSMVLADVLVIGASAFSYAAGMLSEGKVYYFIDYHKPLPNWIKFNLD